MRSRFISCLLAALDSIYSNSAGRAIISMSLDLRSSGVMVDHLKGDRFSLAWSPAQMPEPHVSVSSLPASSDNHLSYRH